MYLQFQFKSFYKIQKNFSEQNYFNQKNVFSSNLIYIIILLISTKKYYKHTLSNLNYTVFQKPTKKKSVIFLRAPYKNKLARLNILRIEYTTILSIKQRNYSTYNYLNEIFKLKNYNFSFHKLKHTKTKINFIYKYKNNFQLKNYL